MKFVNKGAGNNISAYENENVTLCAVVNRERANVRWLKDGQLLNKDNVHISSEGSSHRLTINPLQLSDSGEYVCDANTDEMYFSLSVKGKNLALSSDLKESSKKSFSTFTYFNHTLYVQLIRNVGEVYQATGERFVLKGRQPCIAM